MLLIDMLLIILLWGVAFVIVSLMGIVLRRYIFHRTKVLGIFLPFWLGYGGLIVYLQIYHLWGKIDFVTFTIPFLVASWGMWILCNDTRGKRSVRTTFTQFQITPILGVALFILWLANRALHPGFIDDTGLYHYGVVKWFHEYSILPGLGNLHGRLAFNNSNLLFNAFIDPLFSKFGAVRLANGLLIAVIATQSMLALVKWISGKSQDATDCVFVLFIPIIFYLGVNGIGMSTDIPNFIIGILVSSLFIQTLLPRSGSKDDDNTNPRNYLWLIVFFCSLGVTIKLSFIVFGFLICLSMALLLSRKNQNFKPIKELFFAAWIPFLFIGVYIIRGYIMSGYPFYPSTFGALPFDWAIPENYVIGIAEGIKAAARMFGWPVHEIINGWKWLEPWIEQQMLTVKGVWVVLLPTLLILFALSLKFLKKSVDSEENFEFLVGLCVFLLSVLFWFFQAPTPRFAGVIFWYFAIYIIGERVLYSPGSKLYRKWIPSAVIGFVIGVFCLGLLKDRKALLTAPSEASHEIPSPKIKTFTSDSGLVLYVPDEIGAMAGLSWDTPLPATPNPKKGLILRDPNDMSKGFKIVEND